MINDKKKTPEHDEGTGDQQNKGQVTILDGMINVLLIEKVHFEQRCEGGERVSHLSVIVMIMAQCLTLSFSGNAFPLFPCHAWCGLWIAKIDTFSHVKALTIYSYFSALSRKFIEIYQVPFQGLQRQPYDFLLKSFNFLVNFIFIF